MQTILLCLHGWGGSKESFTELREALQGADLAILTPDLPGFGQEPDPPRAWNTDEYAAWTEEWLIPQLPEHARLFIVGHSHGGRIAMKLALRANLKIDHLFLCAAAGIKRVRHLKRIFGLTLAKIGRVIFSIPGLKILEPFAKKLLYKLVRVHDYEKASPVMQQTLIRVTEEDFRPQLPGITIPTDIFWGKDDSMTPVADARVINEGIKGSHLWIFPGVRHRVHRDRAAEIAKTILSHVQ